jgi:methyltransferase-like protein/cyclopropane fatty-acyl-phospholipid synthase-like methyltransferase
MDSQGTSYDDVPYDDQVFSYTHPDLLATIATVFGMEPPPVERCRVLELGCAAGNNLIAIAQGLPGSRCVGIDLSARQIAAGNELVAALGMTNVELKALDLAAADQSLGTFDYILCHGVYSWVPPAVRERILSLCASLLNPQGVAYVSYNTYPGWHLRGLVREMMLFHAGHLPDPLKRVQQARAILNFLCESADIPDSAYGRLLRDEANLLKKTSDAYILHEHLEANNLPVYFYEFAAQAAAHGLQYLSEAEFAPLPGRLTPKALEILGQAPDLVRLEQYLDFAHNRTFRQTLLCHKQVVLQRPPTPARVPAMHASGLARPVSPRPDIASPAPERFTTSQGFSLSTGQPLLKATLMALFEAMPHALSFDELWEGVSARLAALPDVLAGGRPALAEGLLRGFLNGSLYLHVHPARPVTEISGRPVASPLARFQAGRSSMVTNVWNSYVKLDTPSRALVPYLDGSRDPEDLVEVLADLVLRGELAMQHEGKPVQDREQVRHGCRASLGQFLDGIAKSGLLVG